MPTQAEAPTTITFLEATILQLIPAPPGCRIADTPGYVEPVYALALCELRYRFPDEDGVLVSREILPVDESLQIRLDGGRLVDADAAYVFSPLTDCSLAPAITCEPEDVR